MPQSINELLEEWEQIKQLGCPTAVDIIDVSEYAHAKSLVDALAQEIRNSRLLNDQSKEVRSTTKFIEAYCDFSRDFLFRTLKNDRKT